MPPHLAAPECRRRRRWRRRGWWWRSPEEMGMGWERVVASARKVSLEMRSCAHICVRGGIEFIKHYPHGPSSPACTAPSQRAPRQGPTLPARPAATGWWARRRRRCGWLCVFVCVFLRCLVGLIGGWKRKGCAGVVDPMGRNTAIDEFRPIETLLPTWLVHFMPCCLAAACDGD